jgi:hypothetical protein
VVGAFIGAVVDALAQRRGAACQFVYGKVFHDSYPISVSALPMSSSARRSGLIATYSSQCRGYPLGR